MQMPEPFTLKRQIDGKPNEFGHGVKWADEKVSVRTVAYVGDKLSSETLEIQGWQAFIRLMTRVGVEVVW